MFEPDPRDRVEEAKIRRSQTNAPAPQADIETALREKTGLAVPLCQSNFIAGTDRRKSDYVDVAGIFTSVCVHRVVDQLFGLCHNIFLPDCKILMIIKNIYRCIKRRETQ